LQLAQERFLTLSMSAALRSLIVDDETHARENLQLLIEDFCPELKVVGQARNIREAKRQIKELDPEVVFLDIRMPSGSEGFDLIEQIDSPTFQVVFVTAFKDYAVKAFQANAVHYILKPIDIEDLKNATQKLQEYQGKFNSDRKDFTTYLDSVKRVPSALSSAPLSRITLFHAKGFKIAKISEIIRLEAENNCTKIVFENGNKYLDTKTLKIFDDLLEHNQFCRVHKSHLIHLEHLTEYINHEGNFAFMSNGDQIPIARSRLSNFLSEAKKI